MYLWKVDNLVDDFRTDKVSQKEEFKYMLFYSVLIPLSTDPFLIGNSSYYNVNDFLISISILAISIWGIYYCYKINSSGDNKYFYVRVSCIGVPVFIRVFAAFITAMSLMFFYPEPLVEEILEEDYQTQAYEVVITVTFLFIIYFYLGKKMRAVSSQTV